MLVETARDKIRSTKFETGRKLKRLRYKHKKIVTGLSFPHANSDLEGVKSCPPIESPAGCWSSSRFW